METRDEPSGPTRSSMSAPAEPTASPEDECGLAGHPDAVAMRWSEGERGELELDLRLHEPLAAGDELRARFRLTRMPVDERGVRDVGPELELAGSASLSLPAELVEVIASGEAHAAFVIVTLCHEDEPQGNCEQLSSEELYIEDGRAMTPGVYEQHLREKWAADKPWLFETGHPTHIIDMKGR